MALFKILKGKASGLSAKPAVEGYCYFTTDDGKFYIDIASASKATIGTNRICLNAAKADLALKADKLTTARTIALSGSVTGSASFDGSGNITIATTTNHTHSYAGSSSAGGSANSAVKLQTARKIGSASFDGTADITLAQIGAQAAGNYIRGVSANGYWGLARPDNNTTDYIRTTSSGFIPYQSGNIGSGHCYIGTSGWYFGNSYIDNSYVNKVHFNNGSANISYDATNKSINFNFA